MSDDELIAEFMGFKKNIFEPEFYVIPRPFNDYGGLFCSREFVSFRNWAWLMPVVDKIESDLIHPKFNFAVHIGKTVVDIVCVLRPSGEDPPHDIVVYKNPNDLSKIEMTYQAVVEFIKWYNQNKL